MQVAHRSIGILRTASRNDGRITSPLEQRCFRAPPAMAGKAERPRIVILQGRSRTCKPKCRAALSSCQEARRPS